MKTEKQKLRIFAMLMRLQELEEERLMKYQSKLFRMTQPKFEPIPKIKIDGYKNSLSAKNSKYHK